MAMVVEELDEFEVLWPDTDAADDDAPPPAISPAPPVQPYETRAPTPRVKHSRPVDVPCRGARLHRWNWRDGGASMEEDGHGSVVGKVVIVPPHLLLLFGVRRPEEEEEEEMAAAPCTLPSSLGTRPCKRARDLRHLRNSVLRMTGDQTLRMPWILTPPYINTPSPSPRRPLSVVQETAGDGDGDAMEEFQEADILWPEPAEDNSDDGAVVVTTTPSPVARRPVGSPESSSLSAPVEIAASRRKRRSRSWASEYNMFDQTNDDDDAVKKKMMNNGVMVAPPHAIVDRRRLRGRTAAYSMCAGKGRTLKGRDLRNVRNLDCKLLARGINASKTSTLSCLQQRTGVV
uniref:Uncharacterized protein n=1 Tax=Oryza rufipogon TaxID=4529 RepID=A0A0E0PQB2_ORYRU